MFNLFSRDRQNRIDRLEEAFVRNTNLLERVIAIQERQQSRLDQHDTNFERMLDLISHTYDEIRGLRTESLRIQRHIFGDEVDGDS